MLNKQKGFRKMKFQQISEGLGQEADVMEQDHEVQMARADCFHAAKNAIELHQMLRGVSERQGLEGWVSEKITLASDYLRTVKEYLEYEMLSKQQVELPSTDYDMTFESYMNPKRKRKISEDEKNSPKQQAEKRITTPGLGPEAREMLIKGYGKYPEARNDLGVLASIAADLGNKSKAEIVRLDRENRAQDREIEQLDQLSDQEAAELARIKQEINQLEQAIIQRRRAEQSAAMQAQAQV